ncbi:MAG: hypothetical protein PHH77_10830 [Victivallaceae bacterium]|nr:hypothetical protein [Victivallaceae bacterium]
MKNVNWKSHFSLPNSINTANILMSFCFAGRIAAAGAEGCQAGKTGRGYMLRVPLRGGVNAEMTGRQAGNTFSETTSVSVKYIDKRKYAVMHAEAWLSS